MMKHDLSSWPLVLSVSQGMPSFDDLPGYSAAWAEWLDRGQRFATLRILLDSEAHEHPPGGARERKTWFSIHGDRLKEQVVGMAIVAPAEVVEHMSKIKTDRLLGVPARAFVEMDDAFAWLLPLLDKGINGMESEKIQLQVMRLHREMEACAK
ncbi:TPA: hypothetical protein ACXNHL_000383 [Serratia marcescens]